MALTFVTSLLVSLLLATEVLHVHMIPTKHTNGVSRMMNNTNFESHNLVNGGCDPVVTSNYTLSGCQAACDHDNACDMWTYVPRSSSNKGPAMKPWCCLKGCSVQRAISKKQSVPEVHGRTTDSTCPPATTQVGVVSGVKSPQTYGKCTAALLCFDFNVDWESGSVATTLPIFNFSVRKLEAIYYPEDGNTYAYVDIVNFSDPFYPDSYSSEVGVYSSPNGFSKWTYHGIVIPRGPMGHWDGGGIASPGAAVAADGTVLVGYAAEASVDGGTNRGIGIATAPHPLGPFTKSTVPVASPTGICGGSGRCDDVIMQSRPGGEIHLYHSVKGSDVARNCKDGTACIHHRMTTDKGLTWSNTTLVLSSQGRMETIAGKYFPNVEGGVGGMVLITDAPSNELTPYVSTTMDGGFKPTNPAVLQHHPPTTPPLTKGTWANIQIGFIPDNNNRVSKVAYALYTGEKVWSVKHQKFSMAYTHTIYNISF